MKTDDRIPKIIQDLYPSRGKNIAEPVMEYFTDGKVYYSDPTTLDRARRISLELGKRWFDTIRKMEEWDKKNCPNLCWLRTRRLFLSNRFVVLCENEKTINLRLAKLNHALLFFFLNHNGFVDKTDLNSAKLEIQRIYTNLGREKSQQLQAKEQTNESMYRDNDWFSKLVNSFNKRPDPGISAEEVKRYPSEYGIRIYTRNAQYDFERSILHDFELKTPYEIQVGDDSLKRFKEEIKNRKNDIEREKTLIKPIRKAIEDYNQSIGQKAQYSWFTEACLELGKQLEKKREQSVFEKWYKNDNLKRIIVSYGTKEYYSVTNGTPTPIVLPPQQLSLLLLFARHKTGLTLEEIRDAPVIKSELNQIYHQIKRSSKKDLLLSLEDRSHPNAQMLNMISKLKKNGFHIARGYEDDDHYFLHGIYELIEISP